jgi:hypothetical protein
MNTSERRAETQVEKEKREKRKQGSMEGRQLVINM